MRLPLLIALSILNFAIAQTPKKVASHAMEVKPVLLSPDDLKWMASPPETGLPSVVQMTVLSGVVR